MKPRALAAELIGTFALTLAVAVSIHNPGFPVPTPVIAGVTVALLVYALGPVSGCHINPAVTVGVASVGKIEPATAAAYILAQFAGALLALALASALLEPAASLVAANSAAVGLAELLGAAAFLFGLTAVVLGVVPPAASGLVIGGFLFLGIHLAAHASNGVLNPAVALGIGSFSPAYVWGPLVGAVVGANLYRLVGGGTTA